MLKEVLTQPSERIDWPSLRVRWAIWALFVLAWSAALLVPNPVSDVDEEVFSQGSIWKVILKILDSALFSKLVHISAYACFTILTGWLRVPGRWRWFLLAALSAHTMTTEFLQSVMGLGRHGQWSDVGLDHIGIALGLIVSWKWWGERK